MSAAEQTAPGQSAARAPDAAQNAGPGILYRRSGIFLVRLATLVLVLVSWEWYASGVSTALLPAPSRIAGAFVRLAVEQTTLWEALSGSIATMFVGLALSIAVGIPTGMLMGRYRTVESVLDPYVLFLYVLPSVAFVPVLVVMLGIDVQLRLALIFMSAVFPLIINTMAGVRHVDSELVDGGLAFCASERQIMWTILLPGSLPFIFAGLRIGFSAAWVGAIVAEMTAIITGMGGLLLESAVRFRTADVFVAIFGIMAVAVSIQWFTARLEYWLTPWSRVGHETH